MQKNKIEKSLRLFQIFASACVIASAGVGAAYAANGDEAQNAGPQSLQTQGLGLGPIHGGGNHGGGGHTPPPGGNHGGGGGHTPPPGGNHGGGGGHTPPPGGNHGGGGHTPPPGGNHGGGGHHGGGNHPPVSHDHHGNIADHGHQDRIREANRRGNDMRHDQHNHAYMDRHDHEWREHGRHECEVRYDHCNHWHEYWGPYYYGWYGYGFCGGYYYGFHPYYEINLYYWNPLITWFYVSEWDDYYYRSWYGDDYDAWVELHRPYRHLGIFYPTEEFRDMNLSVSAMPIREQINYREAMGVLGDRLAQELSNEVNGSVFLGRNDVVIDHYQFMPEGNAIVVEGFVTPDARQFPFKALLDLENPEMTDVFVPSHDGDPTPSDLATLKVLNDRIVQLGGTVETGSR